MICKQIGCEENIDFTTISKKIDYLHSIQAVLG